MKEGSSFKRYNLMVDESLWIKFTACLKKVFWKEEVKNNKKIDINEGIVRLIKKFVEENWED